MGLLLLLAAAIGIWAWKDGRLKSFRYADLAAAVAALIGIRFFEHGSAVSGTIALGGAAAWAWFRMKAPSPEQLTETEALALLELPIGADAPMIRAAHRRLITRVHPDHGGTADLARRVNPARDTLLAATPDRGLRD